MIELMMIEHHDDDDGWPSYFRPRFLEGEGSPAGSKRRGISAMGHGYDAIQDAAEMDERSGRSPRGHKGKKEGKEGEGGRSVRSRFTALASVFIAACLLAAAFDEPLSMKSEEAAVAAGTTPMVFQDADNTAAVGDRARASAAVMPKAISGMVLSDSSAHSEGPHSFRFTVPANAQPGHVMHIMVPGSKELHDVKIPQDAKPGDMMFLTLPALATKEGGEGKEEGGKEGEENEGKEGEDTGLTEEEMEHLINKDLVGFPEEVEELGTFKGERKFWKHWFLCVFTFVFGCTLVSYAIRGVFHGFGPIEVDPRKLPDHPCRFNDPQVAELAVGHMEMYGDDAGAMASARSGGGTGRKSPVGRSPVPSPRDAPKAAWQGVDEVTPKHTASEAEGGSREEEVFGWRVILEEAKSEEVWLEVWNRGKWLLVLLLFQSTSSIVLASFEELIKHHLTLTLFLTMLVGTGGNAGAQSVVKDVSLIAAGHTPGSKREWQRALTRTVVMALALSVGLGVAAYVRVFFFKGTLAEALAIALSCAIIVCSGVLVGTWVTLSFLRSLFSSPSSVLLFFHALPPSVSLLSFPLSLLLPPTFFLSHNPRLSTLTRRLLSQGASLRDDLERLRPPSLGSRDPGDHGHLGRHRLVPRLPGHPRRQQRPRRFRVGQRGYIWGLERSG